MTQKGKRGLGKNTFGEINVEAIVMEDVKESAEVVKMSRQVRTSNQDIIKIDENKGRSRKMLSMRRWKV